MKLQTVKDAWLMVGLSVLVAVLSLLALEGGLRLLFRLERFRASEDRVGADTYGNQPWVRQYFTELGEVGRYNAVKWQSYVYWRHVPYRGEFVNVTGEGVRLTTATTSTSPATMKIFMFGGSTLWGAGARDAFTIPSVLGRELHNQGIEAAITNFGETGYVSTQEVITLLLELQKGHVPDLVIFYDGINDTYSAYQQHVAGLPSNEFNRAGEFQLSTPDHLGERWTMDLRDVTQGLATTRFLKLLLRRTGLRPASAPPPDPPDMEALARSVVAVYAGNMEIVRAVGEHYGFHALFYWQPTILGKRKLTEYEQRHRQMRHEPFFEKAYDAIRASGLTADRRYRFRDLSEIFADVREPVYIEWHHLGESGNEMVARSMVDDVVDVARQRARCGRPHGQNCEGRSWKPKLANAIRGKPSR